MSHAPDPKLNLSLALRLTVIQPRFNTQTVQPPAQTELIRAAAGTKRGRAASVAQRLQIVETASALERLNPEPEPVASRRIDGRWSLLYQGQFSERHKWKDMHERA